MTQSEYIHPNAHTVVRGKLESHKLEFCGTRTFEDGDGEAPTSSFTLLITQPNQPTLIVGLALATEPGFPEQHPQRKAQSRFPVGSH